MDKSPPMIGIDFGTSNCRMAWFNSQTKRAEPLLNAERELKTPALVFVGETGNLAGKPVEVLLDAPADDGQRNDTIGRVIWRIKRNLITPPCIGLPGGRQITPVEVAAEILRKLKGDAERLHFHESVTRAVVACPWSFETAERNQIREAGRLAGFTELECIDEPVAAAFAYVGAGETVGKAILVYHLGGSTFDLTVVVRDEHDGFRVAIDERDCECGGDYFDSDLHSHWVKQAKAQLGKDDDFSCEALRLALLPVCKAKKESLSEHSHVRHSISLSGGKHLDLTIDRDEFEGLIRQRVESTIRKTEQMLGQARQKGFEIDMVLLTGGSTEIPLVRQSLARRLPVSPLTYQYRDIAVALGAAASKYYSARQETSSSEKPAGLPGSGAAPSEAPAAGTPDDPREPARLDQSSRSDSDENGGGVAADAPSSAVTPKPLIEGILRGFAKRGKPQITAPMERAMPRMSVQVARPPLRLVTRGQGSELQSALETLDRINRKHGDLLVPLTELEGLNLQLEEFRFTLPLLGHFSSGKSALLNAWLHRPNLLREGLSPTTSMPVEIFYSSPEQVRLVYREGPDRNISMDQFTALQDGKGPPGCRNIAVGLEAEVLKRLESLTIVDMPGFDSGQLPHDEAINAYADSSVAYLAVFDANDTVRESILRRLDELSLLDVDFHVVITKCDLKPAAQLDSIEASIRETLKLRTAHFNFRIARTSALNGDISKLGDLVSDLAARRPRLLTKRFAPRTFRLVQRAARTLRNHLALGSIDERELLAGRQAFETMRRELRSRETLALQELNSRLKSAQINALERMREDFVDLVPVWAECSSQPRLADELRHAIRRHLALAQRELFDPILREFSIDLDGLNNNADRLSLDIFGPSYMESLTQSVRSIGGKLETMLHNPPDHNSHGILKPVVDFLGGPARREREDHLRARIVPEMISHCNVLLDEVIEGRVSTIRDQLSEAVKAEFGDPEAGLQELEQRRRQMRETLSKMRDEAREDLEELLALEGRLNNAGKLES
jgi:actin-like ATPase involved in cell morphogenesis/GTPase SAR1 family protein